MKLLALCLTIAGVACAAKMTLKDLPPAVQKGVQENLKGGEIKSISKETEKGVTQYEIESMLNGKHRDFNIDTKGGLVVMEEETAIDSIPGAAKDAIMKKVGDGKLGLVETLARPGKDTLYEAAFTTKAGKKTSVLVKADGTPAKE